MKDIQSFNSRLGLETNLTKTSIFLKFLIKICFLPVTIDRETETLTFRFLSIKSFLYVLLYIGPSILINFLWSSNAVKEFNTKQTALEVASGWLSLFSGLCLLFPPGMRVFRNTECVRV